MEAAAAASSAEAGADDPLAAQLARLERENAKLRKINKVLIDRVERSMDFQGNAFSLFQTAIVLEGRVRDRTRELEETLHALARSNRDLRQAREDAETARMRLSAAIESISDGFLLCDADGRLVLCNDRYRAFWPELAGLIQPGVPFAALVAQAQRLGLLEDADVRRLTALPPPDDHLLLQLRDGRWLQVRAQATAEGGQVAIYSDITGLKRAEEQRREQELAAKNAILGATFDNILQGIAVVGPDRGLLAWNERFLQLLGIVAGDVAVGTPLAALLQLPEIAGLSSSAGAPPGLAAPLSGTDMLPVCLEQPGAAGRMLEIQLNALPEGGMVCTFTDITERKAVEWALRDSEQRIRLITDALPALIAYVDAGQRYRFTNKPYEDWFGRPRSEINGRHMRSVLGATLYDNRRSYVDAVLAGQQVTFEISLPKLHGSIEHALATYVPHCGSDGSVLGFFALIQDITERKKSAEQLREAKETLERRVIERTAELTSVNRQLTGEIAERRQAEDALRLAKAAADDANMSKTKFIAAASHDLLQPLHAARVFTGALCESRLSPRNRQTAEQISKALASVEELLTALLDIARLDSGAQVPQISDFSLDDLLSGLISECRPQAAARGLALRLVPCALVVRSDRVMVRRILRNFLTNAMRYTPAGRILVGCRRLGPGVAVQVWDTGIGIPADKLQDVFQEFHRLAPEAPGQDSGIGLGLAIVERIARRLGHPLQVASWPGQGSLFGVVLPLGNRLAASAAHAALAARPPLDKVAGSLVALLDNDAAVRAGMEALLTSWRCTVLSAADEAGLAARLAASPRCPDLLILDYHLDYGHTGLDALPGLQAVLPQPVPVVVLTADRSDAVQAAVRDCGGHVLNKPLKPARLRSLLAHVLQTEPLLAAQPGPVPDDITRKMGAPGEG